MSLLPPRRRGPIVLPVLGALACGIGIAVQARINGALAVELGNSIVTALISFGSGLGIVLVWLALTPSGQRGTRVLFREIRQGRTPWWYTIGGTAGAFLVFSQGLVAGVLGVSLFSIGVVAGQTLSGMLIDRHGFGTMAPKRITLARVAGAVLALVAVVIGGSGQLHGDVPVWMLLFPFVAGLAIAWQQAANGQVRQVSGSVVTATLMNFVVGTAVLLVGTLVATLWTGWPSAYPGDPVLYLGGAVGVIFIALAPLVVPYLGVLLLTLGTIAGQLIGSLVLDILVPAPGHELGPWTIVGILFTFVAVLLAAWPARGKQATAS